MSEQSAVEAMRRNAAQVAHQEYTNATDDTQLSTAFRIWTAIRILPVPIAEGQEALEAVIEDEQASHLDTLRQLTEARADLARMKAAMERIVEVGTRNETQVVGDMWDFVGGYNDYTIVSEEANIATEALAALKGTSP